MSPIAGPSTRQTSASTTPALQPATVVQLAATLLAPHPASRACRPQPAPLGARARLWWPPSSPRGAANRSASARPRCPRSCQPEPSPGAPDQGNWRSAPNFPDQFFAPYRDVLTRDRAISFTQFRRGASTHPAYHRNGSPSRRSRPLNSQSLVRTKLKARHLARDARGCWVWGCVSSDTAGNPSAWISCATRGLNSGLIHLSSAASPRAARWLNSRSWTVAACPGRCCAHLESVLGATPRGFESRILRRADQGKHRPAVSAGWRFEARRSQLVVSV
jgi:hypothetical protein